MRILNQCRSPYGLFTTQGSQLPSLQENLFAALGLETIDPILAVRTYKALLGKLMGDQAQTDTTTPNTPSTYTHVRFGQSMMPEQEPVWNLFTTGLLLCRIGVLTQQGYDVLDDQEKKAVQHIAAQLVQKKYWQIPDTGMWGKESRICAVSIGACVAGLEQVKKLADVPDAAIREGKRALQLSLQQELAHATDCSLLSLIYPFDCVTEKQRNEILTAVESRLYRERGLIRFEGDGHCYKEAEAEWPAGFAWLALIYKKQKDAVKCSFYVEKVLRTLNEDNELPELFFGNTHFYNSVCPSLWGQALLMAAVGGK